MNTKRTFIINLFFNAEKIKNAEKMGFKCDEEQLELAFKEDILIVKSTYILEGFKVKVIKQKLHLKPLGFQVTLLVSN